MKYLSYTVATTGLVLASISSVRFGALLIALGLGIFVAPQFPKQRAIERVISLTLIVALVTVALALPR